MRVGDERRLTLPPQVAYGSQKIPGIPPNSTLVFVSIVCGSRRTIEVLGSSNFTESQIITFASALPISFVHQDIKLVEIK